MGRKCGEKGEEFGLTNFFSHILNKQTKKHISLFWTEKAMTLLFFHWQLSNHVYQPPTLIPGLKEKEKKIEDALGDQIMSSLLWFSQ